MPTRRKTDIETGYKYNITPKSKYFDEKIKNDPVINHLIKEKWNKMALDERREPS